MHLKCMQEWAMHAQSSGETVIRCPLCREDFGPPSLLREQARHATRRTTHAERNALHLGTTCNGCRRSPIQGTCYQCSVCARYALCHTCFSNNLHEHHRFDMRDAPTAAWLPAVRHNAVLPTPLVVALQQRELTDADYALLVALDSTAALVLSAATLARLLPARPASPATAAQCSVCNSRIAAGSSTRTLPCRHLFHTACIDPWLTTQRNTCPIDGLAVCAASEASHAPCEKHTLVVFLTRRLVLICPKLTVPAHTPQAAHASRPPEPPLRTHRPSAAAMGPAPPRASQPPPRSSGSRMPPLPAAAAAPLLAIG